MEQTKGRRAFCIGLSILIALLVWFYANDDTEIEISVNDVPIEFTNEDTTLADKGLMLLSNEEETIDLKLSMPRSTYFKLDPGKIRIVVDLSSVTTTGTQTITYSVLYPRGPRGELLSSSITQKEPTVRSTTIEIGELFRKNVEIRCKVVGNVAEGYIAGTVRMLPETLEVRGQQVDIMQVSYAQVTLNIENATSTVVELLGFELYDFSDQLIRSNRIHPASESIQVTMPVMTVKEVPAHGRICRNARLAARERQVGADADRHDHALGRRLDDGCHRRDQARYALARRSQGGGDLYLRYSAS